METEKPTPPINLFKALVSAKKNFTKIIKNKENPHFKSKYADLDAILEATETHLLNEGLLIYTDIAPQMLFVHLIHAESGESIHAEYPINQNLSDQQKGSAISYGRRYCITCLLNVTSDEDDDGNGSKKEPKKTDTKKTEFQNKYDSGKSPTGTPPASAIKDEDKKVLQILETKIKEAIKGKYPLDELEAIEKEFRSKEQTFQKLGIFNKGIERINTTRTMLEGGPQ